MKIMKKMKIKLERIIKRMKAKQIMKIKMRELIMEIIIVNVDKKENEKFEIKRMIIWNKKMLMKSRKMKKKSDNNIENNGEEKKDEIKIEE